MRAIHTSDAIVVDEMPTAQEKQERQAKKQQKKEQGEAKKQQKQEQGDAMMDDEPVETNDTKNAEERYLFLLYSYPTSFNQLLQENQRSHREVTS